MNDLNLDMKKFMIEARIDKLAKRHEMKVKTSFSIKSSRVAGRACYSNNTIIINPAFLERNYDEILEDTILHEFAHLLSNKLYGSEGRGHGRSWKFVMRFYLGIKEPSRTHNYDNSHLKPFKISCSCSTHHLTKNKFNRIKKASLANKPYHCTNCKEDLR